MKQVKPDVEAFARIRVIGVGGSGKNAVNHMINSKVKGVEFVVINTDAQDLHHSLAKKKIHIGKNLTRGLGTGMQVDVGKRAAEETKEEVQESLKGSDMVFITCGMGGGTGTGATPIIARSAKELGILTVAVVTKPFSFEGQQRMKIAEQGLEDLKKEVDAMIVIPNDRLLAIVEKDTTVKAAFAICDDILRQAVEGISDLITIPGIINVDFADIRAVMENAGSALMGIGTSSGEKRAEEAARAAISSPLLELSINGAKGVLFAVAGGDNLGMLEVQDAARVITEAIDPNAKVIFGAVNDDRLKKNELKVTVIATGFPNGVPSKSSSSSLFQLGQREKEVSEPEQATKTIGKIYNTLTSSGVKKDEVKQKDKKEGSKEGEKKTEPAKNDDDDDWGGVPAFLRRSKLK
ncbi:cell division protein FtsZ [Patescibacteria group bacterium]|nr:cell division protein FtsZ [Patescibacteria group bacterium]